MGLIDNVLKALRREPTEVDREYTASTIRTADTIQNTQVSQNPKDFARVGRALAGSIYNAATLVAREAAKGEMKLYRKKFGVRGAKAMQANAAEDVEQVTDHPVLDLLHDPDPSTTYCDFMTLVYWYREVTGKAYIWVGGPKPVGLFLLHPQYTKPIVSKGVGIEEFMYGRDNLQPMRVPASEVIITRYMPDPFAPWDGISWVNSVEQYADMENAAVSSEVMRWRNSGQYGMIVKAPASYNDLQLKQLESSLRGKGGPLAAGRALIVRDLEVVEAGSKPHEMNYLEGLEQAERAIYRAAGVPEAIWKLNDANLASASAADPIWQRNIYERQQRVAQDLTEWLLPMFGIEPGTMWFAYDNPSQDDVELQTNRMAAGFTNGAVYLNEYRQALGLNPLPDEQNVLGKPVVASASMPMQEIEEPEEEEVESEEVDTEEVQQPDAEAMPTIDAASTGVNVAATALNGAQVQALADLAGQVALGQLPLESARAIAGAAFPTVDPVILDSVFDPLRKFTPEPEVKELDDAEISKTAQRYIDAIERIRAERSKSHDGRADVSATAGEPISDAPVDASSKAADRSAPKGAREEAERGLAWREEYGRGGTAIGVARARDIANGANLSDETIMRMVSYFARHEVDKQGQGWSPGEEGYPSAGRIAWALWGGDPGRTWANAEAAKMDADEEKMCEPKMCHPESKVIEGEKIKPPSELTEAELAKLAERLRPFMHGDKAEAMEQVADEGPMNPEVIEVIDAAECTCSKCIDTRATYRIDDTKATPDDEERLTPSEKMKRDIKRALEMWMQSAMLNAIGSLGMDGKFDESALDPKKLEEVTKQVIERAFEAGASARIEASGIRDVPPLSTNVARDYIAKYNFDLVQGVTNTMKEQLRNAIDRELVKGEKLEGFTLNQLQERITNEVANMPETRAEVVARTETARAYAHGSMKQAEELGFDKKYWSLGGNPCGLCQAAAAKYGQSNPIPIGEPYYRPGETIIGTDGKAYTVKMPIMAPSDVHPNCVCVNIEEMSK
jgi:hypothetical protein